jgi:hypothetical protein
MKTDETPKKINFVFWSCSAKSCGHAIHIQGIDYLVNYHF